MKTVVRQTLTATLSRRRLLGAVLATAAIAAPVVATALPGLPVAVTADPDADLIRLVEEWFAARDEEKRLYKLFTPHEEAHFEKKHKLEAQIPDALWVRPDDVEIGIPDLRAKDGLYTRRDDVNLLRDDKWLYSNGDRTESDGVEQFIWRSWWAAPSPAARARADEIIAASDKWQRKIHRKPRGYRAAERAAIEADQRVWKLHKKIFATQVHTVAGLRAKARIIEVDGTDVESAFLRALARDILAMATA